MKNDNASKFLKGAVAGLVLGVAASIFLSSKTGKKLTQEAKDQMADFYKYIAPKVKEMKEMGEAEYKEFMKNSVHQYGKAKKMSEAKVKELLSEVQKSWKHFSKHISA